MIIAGCVRWRVASSRPCAQKMAKEIHWHFPGKTNLNNCLCLCALRTISLSTCLSLGSTSSKGSLTGTAMFNPSHQLLWEWLPLKIGAHHRTWEDKYPLVFGQALSIIDLIQSKQFTPLLSLQSLFWNGPWWDEGIGQPQTRYRGQLPATSFILWGWIANSVHDFLTNLPLLFHLFTYEWWKSNRSTFCVLYMTLAKMSNPLICRTILEASLVEVGSQVSTWFDWEMLGGKASTRAQSHVRAQYVSTRASHDSACYKEHFGTQIGFSKDFFSTFSIIKKMVSVDSKAWSMSLLVFSMTLNYLIFPSEPVPAWLCDHALETWGKHPISVVLLAQEDIPETTLHSLWPVLWALGWGRNMLTRAYQQRQDIPTQLTNVDAYAQRF